jgi:transcriptional regulator GlxA family with amidase domain
LDYGKSSHESVSTGLADQTAMSVRNFERVFTRELGRTPSQYVLQMRTEAARLQLERTDQGLKQIAAPADSAVRLRCGARSWIRGNYSLQASPSTLWF